MTNAQTSTLSAARASDSAPSFRGAPPGKRALVIGASSGIGAALVKRLVAEGWQVAALARRADLLAELARECAQGSRAGGGGIVVHAHDVTRAHEVPALFETIARELGGVDLVIYAAAIMPQIARDEYDTEKDLDQLAVNVGGCMAWSNAAARLFQTQRHGTLVGISSIAGERGRKGNPGYNATKAAMNTFLEALRNRLSECGAHVVTIKPGFVATDMTKGMGKLLWLISADEAARLILKAVTSRANERFVPRQWWLVALVIRSIPRFIFKKLNV